MAAAAATVQRCMDLLVMLMLLLLLLCSSRDRRCGGHDQNFLHGILDDFSASMQAHRERFHERSCRIAG